MLFTTRIHARLTAITGTTLVNGELDLPVIPRESIQGQNSAYQGFSEACDQLQGLQRLINSYQTGQNSQNSHFCTTATVLSGRRARMEAPKTRPPLSGMEDGHDSLKFVNRTMDHWNPLFCGCVIDNEPGFKVVTGINDDVHPGDQFIDILIVQTP